MTATINGKQITLSPSKIKGHGGEAVVYQIEKNLVAKIFKDSSHPDFITSEEKAAATDKIQEHQSKLPNFPKGTPNNVITPIDMVTNNNQIIGYTMQFIDRADGLKQFSKNKFRQLIPNNDISIIFKDLRNTVDKLHKNNIVIGDFNDLNILVHQKKPYIIDTDSFQYGKWYCKVFTHRFVDPMNCDSDMMLIKPHSIDSDWYAFNTLLFQSLLLVSPYGGVYRPVDKKNMIPHGKRPLQRISVFHKNVYYPKPATPLKVLPDNLLHHFQEVFIKDKRNPFPNELLNLEWKTCTQCGLEHSKPQCPDCVGVTQAAIKETVEVRGQVTATKTFTTNGIIVFAQIIDNQLNYLFSENLKKETEISLGSKSKKTKLNTVKLLPGKRFRIFNNWYAEGQEFKVFFNDDKHKTTGTITNYVVDCFGKLSLFDTNSKHIYWSRNGKLFKYDPQGLNTEFIIGDVLENQTLFWVGEKFGFGFYRAGNYTNTFIFDSDKKGINDTIKLPFTIKGQLIDSSCTFTDKVCWFFITLHIKGKEHNYCTVIDKIGNILFHDEWLYNIRGNAAVGSLLFTPTDEGIKRFDYSNSQEKIYLDTEPFTNSSCYLLLDKEGLHTLDKNSITHLKMK